MTATYHKDRGMYLTFKGLTILLPDDLSIAGVQHYVRELVEFFDA